MSTTTNQPSVSPGVSDDEIDLLEVMSVIWRERILVIAVTLIPTVLAVAYCLMLPKQYVSETTIFPATRSYDSASVVAAGLAAQLDPRVAQLSGVRHLQMPGIRDMLMSRDVAARVVEKSRGLLEAQGGTPSDVLIEQLRGMMTIAPVPGSQALNLQVQASSPVLAAQLVNAYVAGLQEGLDQIAREEAIRQRKLVERHLLATRQSLEADQKQLAHLRAKGGASTEVERLSEEQEAKKSSIQLLLKQREAAILAESKGSSEFLAVDQALPHDQPKKSKLVLLIPVAAMAGLSLGVLLASLRSRLAGKRAASAN